ncbi:MAG: YfgM family protein [Pseudomonadota bacterium]
MDVYRTEEEQIAAIKGWWRDNGVGIAVAVVLALSLFGGWKWYQHHERQQQVAAVGLYQTLMQSWQQAAEPGANAADADARMQKAGEQLLTEHAGSIYARFAGLILAGRAAESEDYATAEKHLRAVRDVDAGDGVGLVATHRLARVLSAQGKHEDALALLAGDVAKEFVTAREDARGDILMAQGKRADARIAWQKALDNADEKDPVRALLEMKLSYVAGE